MNRGRKASVGGAFLRAVTWLILLLSIPLMLDTVGPWQGWIARNWGEWSAACGEGGAAGDVDCGPLFPDAENGAASLQQAPPEIGKGRGQSPGEGGGTSASSGSGAADERNPQAGGDGRAATPLEQQYRAVYDEMLEILPKPEIGKVYTLRTRNGQHLRGRLVERHPGRLILETKYGMLSLPIAVLPSEEIHRFFPARAARNRALEILAFRQKQGETRPSRPATGATSPPTLAQGPEPAERPRPQDGPVHFDPSPGVSTPALLPLVKQFGGWLEVQERRVGGKIASKAFARRQNGRAILYLVMHPQFLAQDYETQFQFAESLWQFWAFRAVDNSAVSTPERAYLVFLDAKQGIIGGSRPERGSSIWVQGGRTTASTEPRQ